MRPSTILGANRRGEPETQLTKGFMMAVAGPWTGMPSNPEGDVFERVPDNWGRWGEEDEIGAINFLNEDAVLEGVRAVSKGAVFTLGAPVCREADDPVWPGRDQPLHVMLQDHGHFASGKTEGIGTREAADDLLQMGLHATTHMDALGHVWYDGQLYNGFEDTSTMGGLDHCSIRPIAEHGVVGRGVLLDVARHRGVSHLEKGEQITLDELQACADAQDTEIRDRDVLLVRTGWLGAFYEDEIAFDGEGLYEEPGITYSDALIEWFQDNRIATYCTDTLTNEQTISDTTETPLPLHPCLLRDLGLPLLEVCRLDELADDCATDDQYDFLFVAGPLKVEGGSAGPVNPVAIK